MTRCQLASGFLLIVATPIFSYRVSSEDHGLAVHSRSMSSDSDAANITAGPRCQYSSPPQVLPTGRPPLNSLVAMCPQNSVTSACLSDSTSGAEVVKGLSTMGVSDCERLCNENAFMDKAGRGGQCLGYVVRNPFNTGVEKGKAQCWLVKGSAKRSESFRDEVKMSRSSISKNPTKLTYIKEYCGCEVRFVHFQRPEWKTELALKRHRLATLRKDSPISAEIAGLWPQVAALELKEQRYQRLETFEGLYDWLPLRPPHRIVKGAEKYIPNGLVRWMKSSVAVQSGTFKNYWDAPVRISKVFKKTDLSAFIYRCLDKTSKEEAWYLATQSDPLEWVSTNFQQKNNKTDEDLKKAIGQDMNLMQKIFFHMQCLGTKIDANNKVAYTVGGETIEATVDAKWLRDAEVDLEDPLGSLTPQGCLKSEQKGLEVREEQVISEVGSCPVESLTGVADEKELGYKSFWKGNASALEKLGMAQWIVDAASSHRTVSNVGFAVAGLVSRGYSWLYDKNATEDGPTKFHEFKAAELHAMVKRTSELLRGISKLFLTMEAASNTEDPQIKLVCANELLLHIFEVKGLLPKVSQNLAMRPDLVKDDFVRNKLKETQNANPSRDEEATMDYFRKQSPKIQVPGFKEPIELTALLKYKKALSAGSVGQVDLFTLSKDLDPYLTKQFMTLLPEGHGDTLIVKTVFQETEEAYVSDWNLLEQFFANMGSRLDPKFSLVWKVLEPMKASIFDEFDLRKEAVFTMKGQRMLAEFTENINLGVYKPTLEPGGIKLTTPNAVATTSPYILLQSIAPGTPLKNHLEGSSGHIEMLAEWKTKIYSAILMIYGHMVVKHGFFQSDPHNGNWFWDESTQTVTLIDWGGVGQLESSTHCKLSNLYSHMGGLIKAWESCDAVTITGDDQISGQYVHKGLSIFDAGENDTALLFGKTYGISYESDARGYRLWYDGKRWMVSNEHPGQQELNQIIAEYETDISDMSRLTKAGTLKWSTYINGDKKRLVKKLIGLKLSDPNQCDVISRSEAYAIAAEKMGLGLSLTCKPEDLVVLPEAPLTQEASSTWVDSGKQQLKCIEKTEDGSFIKWGLHNPMKLAVEERQGERYVKLPDGERNIDIEPAVVAASEWVQKPFDEKSKQMIAQLSGPKRSMLLNAAKAQLALATALYDSDILTAAVLGLDARESVGLIIPDVPVEYVLLARCIVVFHGMLGDVVKENFMRLVVAGQEPYLQWLLRSGGDRFFRSWVRPANEYLAENRDTCSSEGWKTLALASRLPLMEPTVRK